MVPPSPHHRQWVISSCSFPLCFHRFLEAEVSQVLRCYLRVSQCLSWVPPKAKHEQRIPGGTVKDWRNETCAPTQDALGASCHHGQLGFSAPGDLQELFHQGRRKREYPSTSHCLSLAEVRTWATHYLTLLVSLIEHAIWPCSLSLQTERLGAPGTGRATFCRWLPRWRVQQSQTFLARKPWW